MTHDTAPVSNDTLYPSGDGPDQPAFTKLGDINAIVSGFDEDWLTVPRPARVHPLQNSSAGQTDDTHTSKVTSFAGGTVGLWQLNSGDMYEPGTPTDGYEQWRDEVTDARWQAESATAFATSLERALTDVRDGNIRQLEKPRDRFDYAVERAVGHVMANVYSMANEPGRELLYIAINHMDNRRNMELRATLASTLAATFMTSESLQHVNIDNIVWMTADIAERAYIQREPDAGRFKADLLWQARRTDLVLPSNIKTGLKEFAAELIREAVKSGPRVMRRYDIHDEKLRLSVAHAILVTRGWQFDGLTDEDRTQLKNVLIPAVWDMDQWLRRSTDKPSISDAKTSEQAIVPLRSQYEVVVYPSWMYDTDIHAAAKQSPRRTDSFIPFTGRITSSPPDGTTTRGSRNTYGTGRPDRLAGSPTSTRRTPTVVAATLRSYGPAGQKPASSDSHQIERPAVKMPTQRPVVAAQRRPSYPRRPRGSESRGPAKYASQSPAQQPNRRSDYNQPSSRRTSAPARRQPARTAGRSVTTNGSNRTQGRPPTPNTANRRRSIAPVPQHKWLTR